MDHVRGDAEARVGSLLDGKYQLLCVLGVGGMGAVYQAMHSFTERKVAVKLLHPSVARSQPAAARFLAEAKAAARIDHPALAQVLDADRTEEGELYVVFELLEGIDLGRAIKRGRLTAELLIAATLQILDALAVVHERGFVHRDIKPANIFLVRTKEDDLAAKLLDFGIARRMNVSKLTEAGAVIGTPYFMSPEQMAGDEVDGRADLWAVGVVMYAGLSGVFPFKAQHYSALLAEMMKSGPPSLGKHRSDLDRRVIEAVDRSLSPNISDRFGSAAEMAAALKAPRPKPSAQAVRTAPPVRHKWQEALDRIELEIQTLEKQNKKP